MAKGGIATVVSDYKAAGLLRRWNVHYIVTHMQRSRWTKVVIGLAALQELTAMLVRHRVAVLHVHLTSGASTWRKLVYLYTALLFDVPTIVHIHSGDYFDFFDNTCGLLRKRVISIAFKKAAAVVALSASWLPGIDRIAPGKRTVVLPNAVPLPDPDDIGMPVRPDGVDRVPVVLYLGHICANKGVFDLIQAAALVPCNFKLVLAGDGDLAAAQALVRDVGIENRATFTGWIRGAEKDALLDSACLLVLPSYSEGIPMSILEAMARAIPIIATPVGGIPEVLADGREGMLVPVGDCVQLAASITALLSDPERCHQMGVAGRQRVKQTYSPAVVYPQLEALWAAVGAPPPKISHEMATRSEPDDRTPATCASAKPSPGETAKNH